MVMIGQGLVLMVAGMGIVYVFLYVLVLVSNYASRFVSRFDYLLPEEAPKRTRKAPTPTVSAAAPVRPAGSSEGEPVKAPVPGTVLRLSAAEGQSVGEGDEILVMDVMKMETPIKAPKAGTVHINVAVMDKVATGDTIATID